MQKLTPNAYVKSIKFIDYDKLYEKGIRAIGFDLDNTLDRPDMLTDTVDEELYNFLRNLEKRFELIIVSNNTIKNRVKSFADIYKLNYIEAMRKPFKKNYKDELIVKYDKDELILVGDKIITDVLGARRNGYKCILVDPLYPKSKIWYHRIMSLFDGIVYIMSSVKKNNYFDNL